MRVTVIRMQLAMVNIAIESPDTVLLDKVRDRTATAL